MADVRDGMPKGRLPCLAFGEGPTLVVLPGLGMTNANPTGIQRWGELRLLAPLARAFTVYRVGRRVGLEPGTTMTDLVNAYAEALEDKFDGPVDVLGVWAEEWAKEGKKIDSRRLMAPRGYVALPRRWVVERTFS